MYPNRGGPSAMFKRTFIWLTGFSLAITVVAAVLKTELHFSHMLHMNSPNQLYSTQSK